MEAADAILKPWENFYVIVGGAAAALTGLVFVVITIVSGDTSRPKTREGTAVFTTPTVVHFAAALLVAILLSVPWTWIGHAAIPLGIEGVAGIAYMIRTIVRMNVLDSYAADAEDVIWHSSLPIAAYVAITVGALAFVAYPSIAMFLFAIASSLFIFVGIHNAWDIVTFIAVKAGEDETDG